METQDGRKNRRKCALPTKQNNKEAIIKCSHGLQDFSPDTKEKESKDCKMAELTHENITEFHHKIQSQ
ncbi:hypothetical protein C0J52_02343 [Blattella germanica]|nr:hypothetical protein C0J52_02343 [Blattella germanica]